MNVYRFKYRKPNQFGWYLIVGASFHTKDSAWALVREWNKRDQGSFEWSCEQVQESDFDYPIIGA